MLRRPEGATEDEWPRARLGATLAECSPGVLLLCGGAGDGGRPLNDAWCLDVEALTWSRAYAGHPDLLAAAGATLALAADGKLVALGASPGSACLDAVATLDVFGVAASYAFGERMRAEAANLLHALELRAEQQTAALELAAAPATLASSFEALLRVMDALHQARARKGETDLAVDQLRETLRLLAAERAPGVRGLEKRLDDLAARWEGVKRSSAGAKAAIEPVQAAQAERIRGEIAGFTAAATAACAVLKARPYAQWATGAAAAYALVDAAAAELAKLKKECDRFAELACVFELAGALTARGCCCWSLSLFLPCSLTLP